MKPKAVNCKSCGALIIWAITERGKRIPLNAAPDPIKGNMVLELIDKFVDGGERSPNEEYRAKSVAPLLAQNVDRYMPHHATCPQGRQWRR